MADKLNIYLFEDYRELLAALIERRRKSRQTFSYRWFSQRAGLRSPNFLNLVVHGKRHLSSDSAEKVIEIFHLNSQEAEFFRNLVHFNKAKTLSEKEHFAHQLLKIQKYQKEFPLSLDQFEYYSKWYHVPVREMFTLQPPPTSAEEISDSLMPYVAKAEVREALEKLETLGLISRRGSEWQLEHESVATGAKFSSYGVVQFHKKMMALGAESLDRFPAREREISSVTIGLSETNFRKAKKLVEEFRSQLMALSEEDSEKERLYQMNFQVFPLSRKRGESP